MFNKLTSSSTGLIANSHKIQVVELTGTQNRPVLSAFGSFDLQSGIVVRGKVENTEAFAAALSELFTSRGFKSSNISLGINNSDIILRMASFPRVAEDKIRNMIMLQAQEYIPIPIAELELDYVLSDETKLADGTAFINTLLVGAKKDMLGRFIDAFTQADISLREIDSALLSLGRAAYLSNQDDEDKNILVLSIDIDDISTIVFKDKYVSLARSVQAAGASHEVLKKYYDSDVVIMEDDEINSVMELVVNEINMAVTYFSRKYEQSISAIHLVTTLGNAKIIAQRLEEIAKIKVVLPRLFENISITKSIDTTEYAACIGLALRGLR